MKKIQVITILSILILMLLSCELFAGSTSGIDSKDRSAAYSNETVQPAQAESSGSADTDTDFSDDYLDDLEDLEEPNQSIADPLEPINRVFFHFNDKLYFWVVKPAAKGYRAVVPEPARKGIKNFFNNLKFPVRFVNCIFQGKFEGAGIEVDRFLINSTIGLAGFMDIAANKFNMKEYDEDLGQTLGSYGIGQGFYIVWPVLGFSSLTDTIGSAGDAFLGPLNYLDLELKYDAALYAFDQVNKESLRLGDYEALKKAALDPYVSFRNVYFQYRQSEINK
jgi:phospholipid-binding lipoprotein MlaA